VLERWKLVTFTQDPHPDVPCERQRARLARLLSPHWTRRLRVIRLPRWTTAPVLRRSNGRHRIYVHSTRTLVVDRYHDDGRLWWPGTTHLPRDAGGVSVRPARSTDAQPARADHRQQLRTVLLTHEGTRQATQGPSARRRSYQGLSIQDAKHYESSRQPQNNPAKQTIATLILSSSVFCIYLGLLMDYFFKMINRLLIVSRSKYSLTLTVQR